MIEAFLKSVPHEQFKDGFISIDEYGNLVIDKEIAKRLYSYASSKDNKIVINENDTKIVIGNGMPNSKSYSNDTFVNTRELVAVHISPIPPTDDVIVTKENSGVTNEMVFIDPKTRVEHHVPYVIGNDTIHFTLNCTVQNHDYGNDWNSYKYGILIDFDKLNKEKVLDVKSEDTYMDGNVSLEGGYFLFCPLGEREKIEKDNPRAIVIEYDGISLQEAMTLMIIFSGRKLEPYGTYGWGRNNEYSSDTLDVKKLEKLVVSNGYPCLKGRFGYALHSETKYMARRMWKREYEALINLLEYNYQNNIDMPDMVLYQVMLYGGAYSLPGTVDITIDYYKEIVFPILEKHGYLVDDTLFEDINIDNGMKMIYSSFDGSGIPQVNCPMWEITLRKRIIEIIKNKLYYGDKKNKTK